MSTPDRTLQICRKLLENLHLNAEERREFAGARVPFSVMLVAARQALDEVPCLPPSLRPDLEFEGIVVESREDGYWVHECHEVGIGKYSTVATRHARDLADAVRAYVRANGGTAIDGIPIDYGT